MFHAVRAWFRRLIYKGFEKLTLFFNVEQHNQRNPLIFRGLFELFIAV
jgi:hypothetical protein